VSDFVYLGYQVTDDLPIGARMPGATKPQIERYFTHRLDGSLMWSNTQEEMRNLIREDFSKQNSDAELIASLRWLHDGMEDEPTDETFRESLRHAFKG
jgi:hypothetical protein